MLSPLALLTWLAAGRGGALPLFGWLAAVTATFLVPDGLLAAVLFGDASLPLPHLARLAVGFGMVSLLTWPFIVVSAWYETHIRRVGHPVVLAAFCVAVAAADAAIWYACARYAHPLLNQVASRGALAALLGLEPIALMVKAYLLVEWLLVAWMAPSRWMNRPQLFVGDAMSSAPMWVRIAVLPPYYAAVLAGVAFLTEFADTFRRSRWLLFVVPLAVGRWELLSGRWPIVGALSALGVLALVTAGGGRQARAAPAAPPASAPAPTSESEESSLIDWVEERPVVDLEIRQAMLDHLRGALESSDNPALRRQAVKGLADVAALDHAAVLIRTALDDSDRDVRIAAIHGLAGAGRNADAALDRLRGDADPVIRWSAIAARGPRTEGH